MNNYLKPINNKIKELKNAPGNGIFLVGEEGSGKTTTLLEYVKQSKNTTKPVVDITLIANNSMELNNEFAKLFHVCNVIQKMLLYIKDVYLDKYVTYFIFFNARITNIQRDIIAMYSIGKYSIERTCIDNIMLNNPEILLEEFLAKVVKYLNYQDITVVLDNFDVEKPYMRLYQTYMYDLLKKYLRVVATISDPTVIKNPQKLNKLNQDNSLVIVDYNREIDTVKRILDDSFPENSGKKIITRKVSFMFSNNTIEKLITKTNGNLFAMILAMRIFFERINEIDVSEYEKCLLDIVDENVNFGNILVNRQKTRKLYMK